MLLLLVAGPSFAGSVTLAWNPVTSPPAMGYKIHYGTAVGNYPSLINVGNVTSYSVAGLADGVTYHFVVTAYATGFSDSAFSNDLGAIAKPDLGLYRTSAGVGKPPYRFLLDYNRDHVPDAQVQYGAAGDIPLVGKISPGGMSSLIFYRNGMWNFDNNRDGITNSVVAFGGVPGDIPLTANFSGPGQLDDIVIYRSGTWYVDTDLSGSANLIYMFGGVPGDKPLAADVNGDGIADLVIYRNGIWYIDTNRNGNADMIVIFGGLPQDIPALFDWDGDGKADLCIFRDGVWYISTKRDGVADVIFGFGAAGDRPMVGRFH